MCIHTGQALKHMPGHGGNRTYDLWNTSPMLALPTELRGQVEYAIFRIPLWPGIFFKPARCGYTLKVTSHKHLIHLSTLHQHSKYLDEMNWSARGNVLNQYLRNTSIGTTVMPIKRYESHKMQISNIVTRA